MIKKISDKRRIQLAEYKKVRLEFLKETKQCQVEGCLLKAAEIHHKKGRSGLMLLEKKWFLGTCRHHHVKIELNPKWARENGYSESRLAI